MQKQNIIKYFDDHASQRDAWRKRNWYYHKTIHDLLRFIIPPGASVLDIGSGTGEVLASVRPSRGLGIDISRGMIEQARAKYPSLEWRSR